MKSGLQELVRLTDTSAKSDTRSNFAQKGMLLAKKIEAGMKKKEVNRQKFANLMGVQPSIITRWLSGSHNFTVQTLYEIENQLEIQLLAIEMPVKEMHLHMVVGSNPPQLHSLPYLEPISRMMPSNVTYFAFNKTTWQGECSTSAIYLEILNKRSAE